MRRESWNSIGGFDETFAYYLDETDVCLRIARSGHAVINDRQSFNRHYKAPSGRRRSPHDIDWNVIARSDTYYALKNAVDRLPRRLLKTIALAPRKHFFREINRGRREGAYGRLRWLRYLARWARGVTAGVWLGLVADRRTPLSPAPPPAFLPFPCARPSRRLRVGLLARVYPPHRQSGGIARYTQELAYGLHALGHEVHVFTESAAGDRREGVRLFVHGISPSPETIIPGMPMTDRNMRWGLAVTERVIELAREGTVLDIVESPNWNSEGAPLRRTGLVPLVVRIHSPLTQVAASERWPASADLQTSIDLERWLVANADGVTSSTAAVLDTVRDTMGLSPAHYARYARIPLGVPPSASAVAVPDCPPRLLFVGRLERRNDRRALTAHFAAIFSIFMKAPIIRA